MRSTDAIWSLQYAGPAFFCVMFLSFSVTVTRWNTKITWQNPGPEHDLRKSIHVLVYIFTRWWRDRKFPHVEPRFLFSNIQKHLELTWKSLTPTYVSLEKTPTWKKMCGFHILAAPTVESVLRQDAVDMQYLWIRTTGRKLLLRLSNVQCHCRQALQTA